MRRRPVLILIINMVLAFSISCSGNDEGVIGIDVPADSGIAGPDSPFVVKRVDRGSPAFDAGLEPGDEIIQINQTVISNGMVFRDIHEKLLKNRPGTGIRFYVRRHGKILVFDLVTAGERR